MQKSHKIILSILIVVVGLLTVNIWYLLHGQSNLRAIQTNITMSQKNIDSAISNINFSRSRLDSVQFGMLRFNNYITSMEDSVKRDEILKEKSEASSAARLKSLRDKAIAEKEELEKTDPVPPVIKIKSL